MNKFQVLTTDAEYAVDGFGVSRERFDELSKIMAKLMREDEDLSILDVLTEATAHAENLNETALITFVLGGWFERCKNPLLNRLKAVLLK